MNWTFKNTWLEILSFQISCCFLTIFYIILWLYFLVFPVLLLMLVSFPLRINWWLLLKFVFLSGSSVQFLLTPFSSSSSLFLCVSCLFQDFLSWETAEASWEPAGLHELNRLHSSQLASPARLEKAPPGRWVTRQSPLLFWVVLLFILRLEHFTFQSFHQHFWRTWGMLFESDRKNKPSTKHRKGLICFYQ